MLDKGAYADLDEFEQSALLVYRTLVLRRSPFASRPPSVYRLVWSGRFYDVWQRSTASEPGRVLSGRSLATALRPSPLHVVALGQAERPSSWTATAGAPIVYPSGPGRLRTSFRSSTRGCRSVWVGGSFRNRLTAVVDGRPVGTRIDQLNSAGQYTSLGAIRLAAGVHVIELRYSRSIVTPGSGGPEYGLGPLVVTAESGERCRSTLD